MNRNRLGTPGSGASNKDDTEANREEGTSSSEGQGEDGERTEISGIRVPYIISGIDNSGQALRHYLFGNGEIAWLGNSTIEKLINSEKFQYHHNRIISGKTEDLSGDFSVDLEGEVFHVGNTNVYYSILFEGDNCSVMYTMFARDRFWDVDYADEFIGGRILGIERYKTDGMGPNLERIGGTPYPYMPIIGTFLFPNPGY